MEITTIVKEDYLILEDQETVSAMIGKLKKYEKRTGLIFRNDKYLGLIEKKKLLRTKLDVTKTKIGKYIQKTPLLNEDYDVIATAYLMFQSNLDYLPVEKDKVVVGVVNALDLIKLAMQIPEVSNLKVKDIKLVKSVQMNKDDPISTAISIMYEKDVDQVPIFDEGEIYGIISFRDILRKYLNWSPKRDVSAKFNAEASAKTVGEDFPKVAELPVGNFSTNDNLVSVAGNVVLTEAVDLMLSHNVSSLLIKGDSGVEGMLSVKNLLRTIGSLKVPENFNIKYVGLNDLRLSESQKYNLQKITSNEASKIQRHLKNDVFSLTIQLKEYRKEGKQHQYAVNLKVEYPGQIITGSQEDWDFETALRKAFNNVKNNVKKKFRN